MARQPFGGLTFERPMQWKERAVLAYDVPGGSFGEHASSLVVTTEPRDPNDTLVGHVRKRATLLARQQRTDKLEIACVLVGEQPGVRMQVEWDGEHGPVVHVSAFLANPLTITEVLVFTLVAGERGAAPTATRTFDALLASVRCPREDATLPDSDEALDDEPVTLRRSRPPGGVHAG
jgi:hypothetical protein